MAVSSLSLSLASTTLPNRLNVSPSTSTPRPTVLCSHNVITCSRDTTDNEERNSKRRPLLLGLGALALSLLPASSLLAEEIPANYAAFVDKSDGYSYYYPSDWREFDFRGHDSAFKDRYLQLQNVRVSFIPTDKSDIHDMGPIEEVIYNLVTHVYSTPTQVADIFDMRERTIDGKNYYTFEYTLTSPNFSRAAFASVAVANGRYYTLIVGANERRWRRVRNKLKVVADSFKVLDI
ncbi:hypothetical protein RJ639_038647 [Escallonia herrerae]|uniref:PsbP C-terminal domain-containing protein n=1 Tax=Escallonia herrerae TaxID=1293975 RepID=A0AA88WY07_9ASTE|nr:hypothetical protein RJ639_038647 [Escallonia herrerae]